MKTLMVLEQRRSLWHETCASTKAKSKLKNQETIVTLVFWLVCEWLVATNTTGWSLLLCLCTWSQQLPHTQLSVSLLVIMHSGKI